MKCFNCNYFNGWDGEKLECVDGEHGGFFRLPIKLERTGNPEQAPLWGCPKCGCVFIDI